MSTAAIGTVAVRYPHGLDVAAALAVTSHRKAVAAQKNGIFAEETVAVAVPHRRDEPIMVSTDEHPRADTSVETPSGLRAIRAKTDPSPPSPRATRADRTTAQLSPSSRHRKKLPHWGSGRWPGWSAGPLPVYPRARSASVRCPPVRGPSADSA